MAKTKCVLCKLHNSINEAKKHFNTQTAFNVKILSNMITNKENPLRIEAISTFCEDHRNPLKLNITLTYCFDEISKLNQYGQMAQFVR